MTVHATARDASAREPAAGVITLPDGTQVPLKVVPVRELPIELMGLVQRLDAIKAAGLIVWKVDKELRENDG